MTNLSRRRFFGLLGGTAATYFLPPIGGWKSDVIHSPSTNIGPIPGEFFWRMESNPGMLWWSKDWILKQRSLGPPISELAFAHRMIFKVEEHPMTSFIEKKLDKQLTNG